MVKSLREKLGLSANNRAILVDVPDEAAARLGLSPEHHAKRLSGRFDYIHLFTKRLGQLRKRLPQLKRHLECTGTLWVSWPKARGHGSDVTLREVIKLAYDSGLVESKTVAFDDEWSAIKLTLPRAGKSYSNSYGRLPENGA